MGIDLGPATNKGTALLKFAHQFQPDVILDDPYVGCFFAAAIAQSLPADGFNLHGTAAPCPTICGTSSSPAGSPPPGRAQVADDVACVLP